MKAIVLNEHGSTGNFSLVEMEKPKAIKGHVVIEVCAFNLASEIILSCLLSVIGAVEQEFSTRPQHPQPT